MKIVGFWGGFAPEMKIKDMFICAVFYYKDCKPQMSEQWEKIFDLFIIRLRPISINTVLVQVVWSTCVVAGSKVSIQGML